MSICFLNLLIDFGNNNIIGYVNRQIASGNLLDASVKKAPKWFTTKGLQLPNVVQTIIDANNSISQNKGFVNTQNKNNSGMQNNKNAPDASKHFHRVTKRNYNGQYDFDDANDFSEENESKPTASSAVEKKKTASEKKTRRTVRAETRKATEDRLFNKRELERLSRIKSELEDADELTVEQVTALWGEMRRLQRNVTATALPYFGK